MESEDPNYLPALSLEGGVAKIVVDTNVLFTFFFKNSVTQKILPKRVFDFCSPVYALEEIKSYRQEIEKKARISTDAFVKLREDLVVRGIYTSRRVLGLYGASKGHPGQKRY